MANDRNDHPTGQQEPDEHTAGAADKLRQTWEGAKEAVTDARDEEDHTARTDSNVAPNPLAEEPLLWIPDSELPSYTSYENRTVEELRELAAQRDITGRSTMTKDELIAALREPTDHRASPRSRYENRTVEELRELATQRDITGRSTMTKDELIAALRR
jgi:hypothetical protein